MIFQISNLIISLAFLLLLAVFMIYAIRAMAIYIEKNKPTAEKTEHTAAERSEKK